MLVFYVLNTFPWNEIKSIETRTWPANFSSLLRLRLGAFGWRLRQFCKESSGVPTEVIVCGGGCTKVEVGRVLA